MGLFTGNERGFGPKVHWVVTSQLDPRFLLNGLCYHPFSAAFQAERSIDVLKELLGAPRPDDLKVTVIAPPKK